MKEQQTRQRLLPCGRHYLRLACHHHDDAASGSLKTPGIFPQTDQTAMWADRRVNTTTWQRWHRGALVQPLFVRDGERRLKRRSRHRAVRAQVPTCGCYRLTSASRVASRRGRSCSVKVALKELPRSLPGEPCDLGIELMREYQPRPSRLPNLGVPSMRRTSIQMALIERMGCSAAPNDEIEIFPFSQV